MYVIENEAELSNLRNNYVLGYVPMMKNSKIIFYGDNNILFCEEGVTLNDSTIEFGASNSIVFLKKSNHKYKIYFKIFNNSTIFIDSNNYFNDVLNAVVSEETNLFIGKNGMYSFGIWMMTADPHLVYDINSLNRINFSKSIYIGDHVWIGQNSTILKGTKVDSGSIIGASSVVPGISIENNSTYAGNPAKMVKNKIFWNEACVHKWGKLDTEKSKKYDTYLLGKENLNIADYIYDYDEKNSIIYDDIEDCLRSGSLKERLEYLIELSKNDNKNRFVHSQTKIKKKSLGLRKRKYKK